MIETDQFNKLDFDSPVPFYIQVRETIRAAIQQNKLQPGELIPSEGSLCDHFGVSRAVIRQALDDLSHDGLIIRKKGKGTFISEPKILERFGQEITGFYHEMTAKSYQIHTEILRQEAVPADKEIAEYLKIAAGEPVVLLRRLRYLQNEPILIVSSFLPFKRCERLLNEDFTNKSLYNFLEYQLGCNLSYGRRTIEANLANSEKSKLLKIKKGDPILTINSIIYLEDRSPIEYYQSHYRADRYIFEVELIKIKEGHPPNDFSMEIGRSLPSSEGRLK